MRFPFAFLAASMHRPVREIDRANRIVAVRAPEGWTDVQVEAWLDWADSSGLKSDGEDPIAETALAWGRRLHPARADALAATMLLGLASPARSPDIVADLIDLSEPDAARRLQAESALRRGQRLTVGAVDAVAAGLQRVADAVYRCEGPRSDCGDPTKNPALMRAALAARALGAADADIVRAIEGERFEVAQLALAASPPLLALADRAMVASGAPEALAAAAAGLDGDLILAFEPEAAEAVSLSPRVPAVLLSLPAPDPAAQGERLRRRRAKGRRRLSRALRLASDALRQALDWLCANGTSGGPRARGGWRGGAPWGARASCELAWRARRGASARARSRACGERLRGERVCELENCAANEFESGKAS